MNISQVSDELGRRLLSLFQRGGEGKRPMYVQLGKFQSDPHWREYIQFHEYFHGETGAGLGASHQTGWTALVAALATQFAKSATKGQAALSGSLLKEAL